MSGRALQKRIAHNMKDDANTPANYIWLYDSTLRDGAQTRGVDFNLADKVTLVRALDDFGIDYIEAGWPGSNPIDDRFFEKAPNLKKSRLTAFGMTRRAGIEARRDRGLANLAKISCDHVCIVGKSWAFQAKEALGISRDENLAMIFDSIRFLRDQGKTVLFDAEHFFDGWKEDADYARACIEQARKAGARWIVLCDTNGGTLPDRIEEITDAAARCIDGHHLAIHCHEDTDNATANSLAAVRAGARQIQGTFNGLGERCGNANLVSILPSLILKMGFKTAIDAAGLKRLRQVSGQIDAWLNRPPDPGAPYIGDFAFSHKGGLHASAVGKNPRCYEHIDPEAVGNRRHILVSVQAGKTSIMTRLHHMGIPLEKDDPRLAELLNIVKERSLEGYSYDGAEASFEILARRVLSPMPDYFTIREYQIVNHHRQNDHGRITAQSTAKVHILAKGKIHTATAEGNGPVHALDNALRRALIPIFPPLADLRLVNYKVRILSPSSDTSAKTRVMITCSDRQKRFWNTLGVSTDVIDASRRALIDAFVWKLFHEKADISRAGKNPE